MGIPHQGISYMMITPVLIGSGSTTDGYGEKKFGRSAFLHSRDQVWFLVMIEKQS